MNLSKQSRVCLGNAGRLMAPRRIALSLRQSEQYRTSFRNRQDGNLNQPKEQQALDFHGLPANLHASIWTMPQPVLRWGILSCGVGPLLSRRRAAAKRKQSSLPEGCEKDGFTGFVAPALE